MTGHYHFYSDIRGDTLQVALTKPFWISTPPYAIPDSAQTVMNFARTVPDSIVDVGITVTETTPFRFGFTTEVLIQVSNYGAARRFFAVLFEHHSAVSVAGIYQCSTVAMVCCRGFYRLDYSEAGCFEVATIRLKLRTPPWAASP